MEIYNLYYFSYEINYLIYILCLFMNDVKH